MARVTWSDAAIDQVDAIAGYIELFDPRAARRIAERLYALGDSLSSFPRRGRAGRDGTRELTMVPPYILIYDVVDEEVTILRVRHGERRPLD